MYELSKNDRLSGKKNFDVLFSKGKYVNVPLVRVLFLFQENEPFSAKAAFIVSKKKYKRAVDRNLLKRRMKEAYRILKPGLNQQLEAKKTGLMLAFIYQANHIASHEDIKLSMISLLEKIKTG